MFTIWNCRHCILWTLQHHSLNIKGLQYQVVIKGLELRSLSLLSHPSIQFLYVTRCPKKHGNSVTNSISSLLWISIVIPNFKSQNIVMSARVYFKKRLKHCKDVSIMSPQDEQWWRTSLLYCILQFSCFTKKYNSMQSKQKQTKCELSRRNSYRLQLSQYVSLY